MSTEGQTGDPGASSGNPGPASGEGAGDAGRTLVTELAQAQPGSGSDPASQGGAQGGQPASSEGTADAATEQALAGWTAGLTKGLKSDPAVAKFLGKFPTMDDAIRGYMELEGKQGSLVSYPSDKSSPEEIAAFWSKAGVPSKPDEYKLDRIQGLTYDDTEENNLRSFFHENHVPQTAAAALYKEMGERMVKEIAAFTARKDEARASLTARLQKEHGDGYKDFLSTYDRGMAAYGSKELQDVLEKTGAGNSYEIIQLFAKLGSLTKEDTAAQRGGAPAGRKTDAEVMYGGSPQA
jgi:hypothetical protein